MENQILYMLSSSHVYSFDYERLNNKLCIKEPSFALLTDKICGGARSFMQGNMYIIEKGLGIFKVKEKISVYKVPAALIFSRYDGYYRELLTGEILLEVNQILDVDIECGLFYFARMGTPQIASVENIGAIYDGFDDESIKRKIQRFANKGKRKMNQYRCLKNEEKIANLAKSNNDTQIGKSIINKYIK